MDTRTHNLLHEPVMVEEVLDYLCPQPGQIILDGTVGNGGHASRIMNKISPGGLLIGMDKDREILQIAKQYLSERECPFKLYHADYSDVDEVLRQAGVDMVHGVLLDLGASSLQFDQAERGFSFSKEGPLDMRMDRSRAGTAQDLIQRLSEKKLEELLRRYGEERWSRRIARAIRKEAEEAGITSTKQLAAVIERVVPRGKSKIHPATRVFQALRIAVNKEMEVLEVFLDKIHHYMIMGARIVIISFHSLEDRIVKNTFVERANQKIFKILTKKPVTPGVVEIERNVRCRSAKLRSAERI
ncbi:MAG: 16S rRNA (cytosine(1402)-N(4))-methyltransferase RsmH [Candidatus Brocadia sp. AMX2]|uniref:Ribosomal RNA small subunit methyltransferase H n=1 Tax=Candidatus Brocadia sinica JPN1 TaxID=1197129 RepID=A0ABQ0K2J3_9BACT|nr:MULTISPECIES: 16S rRNA (cytosine(1402)-N(4))-methyltransferase RsmH [Brocadia]KXK28964.1 MAG: S-adenosyl-methyltransferase [Candidatus Brocadia sinica]MBC6932470.1 16S rRNA (cytosine(1402)-N(4))-methyltransferase RsmH [Candidatus Brocadia sp.]MBL1168855.1 16S rRNA (cytosine(1402)-N(4))-methyltransferase RsmH [Candidatus Brocadia sp. AMX1]NOG42731.1 16S rRNA (cytosine(1402)-N(4))-methyltransferase RsmH [Planctomycetota bacterium]KAA0245149.1 MAG: 16S rRNA (cytosine(1402)-N(4))-methyltransfer